VPIVINTHAHTMWCRVLDVATDYIYSYKVLLIVKGLDTVFIYQSQRAPLAALQSYTMEGAQLCI